MSVLFSVDGLALVLFVALWALYNFIVDHSPLQRRTLAAAMDEQRTAWMRRGGRAEERIASTAILQVLMNGMSIFASATIFVIGGLVAGIGYSPVIAKAFIGVPFFTAGSPALLTLKIAALLVIFIYIFFTLAWAVRLAHYSAIMVGTLGGIGEDGPDDVKRAAAATTLVQRTGYHFNRALRGYFFALAFLGWFFGPLVLVLATLTAISVLIRREFFSETRRALTAPAPTLEPS